MKDPQENPSVVTGRTLFIASLIGLLLFILILYNILEYVWW